MPQNYKWRQFSIVEKSPNIEITSKFNEDCVEINWDLFKRKEYINIDCLVEYCPNENSEDLNIEAELAENVIIESRISNLDKVKKLKESKINFSWGDFIFGLILMACILSIGPLMVYNAFLKTTYEIGYRAVVSQRNYEEVSIGVIDDNNV